MQVPSLILLQQEQFLHVFTESGSLNQARNVPKISVLSKAWFLRGLQCFLELQETTVAQDSVKNLKKLKKN